MGDVTTVKSGDLVEFSPAKSAMKIDGLDAVIRRAKRLKDWEALARAVEEQIEEQAAFVAWWRATVTPNKGGDRKSENQKHGPAFLVSDVEAQTGIRQQQVSRWTSRLDNVNAYREHLFGSAYRAAMAESGAVENHRAQGTGENEWYTPPEHVEAARVLLGEIDLDPATSESAQQQIRAAEFYTAEDDGLSLPWHGKVWLNPPYAQPLIQQFVEKLVSELEAGRVTEAVMLTHNYTDTAWFHLAEMSAARICFTRGRIRFIAADGSLAAPTQGQAFFYYGERGAEFRRLFEPFGFVR